MGAYFSLRGAGEWDRTISETLEPSIWSNIGFSPLNRSRHLLLERPGRLRFSFPAGIIQGEDLIQVSEVSSLSILAGFEESVGQLFAGALLHAQLDDNLHRKSHHSEPEGNSAEESRWTYILLYAVKEGVLAYFAQEHKECEDILRAIAESFGHAAKDAAHGASASGTAAAVRVKIVEYPIGNCAPPVCRVFTDVINADLAREFRIRCDADEQQDCTNCVVFCLRLIMAMQLSFRGYDIQRVCADRSDLGPKVGDAAAAAWELLWRRTRA
mmetsp:Transcript_44536/g.125980  ORF Transcript_44536/g.125980 Transcript_44536/m.125980 type:complete len:270 (-) Transcript_44536:3-812(-)